MKENRRQSTANSRQLKAKSLKLKVPSSKFQVLLTFIKQNYFLLIFVGCIGFVGVVSFYKLFIAKPTYVYAKVKVGQGMWWASTQKPSLWFVKAIQEAKEQKDLTGKPVVTLLGVTYYPYTLSQALAGQYDVYVTVKLKVSAVGKKGTYNFNRETIGVSAPIDLEFPNVQFSGTIIALSEQPFIEKYEYKMVYLTKRIPYPWEFEQIKIGDVQQIGKREVFRILDVYSGGISESTLLQQGTLISAQTNSYTVKSQILVKHEDGQYIFGEEYPIAPGKLLQGVATNNFTFTDYYITKIE